MNKALIVFQKNPVAGKTKTRLAATIGDDNALAIYDILVTHVHEIIKPLDCDKFLYFSDFRVEDIRWINYMLSVQDENKDLGVKMQAAIEDLLQKGYKKVVLIGTDCYEITTEIIESAFEKLDHTDYVFGPAEDGGYYLIGCKATNDPVFLNKEWSHDNVLNEAIDGVLYSRKTYSLIETLSDVDTEDDLKSLREFLT